MKKEQCPICFGKLEIVDTAPCCDCGHDQNEIVHYNEGKHTYHELEIFGISIILCNYCMVDFSSYEPEYFGLSRSTKVGFGSKSFKEIRILNHLSIQKDKFCPSCGHRLTFLKWLRDIRERNMS